MELTITDAQTVLADACEGCSIAVNGVCLTVVTFDSALGVAVRVCVPHMNDPRATIYLIYAIQTSFTNPTTLTTHRANLHGGLRPRDDPADEPRRLAGRGAGQSGAVRTL